MPGHYPTVSWTVSTSCDEDHVIRTIEQRASDRMGEISDRKGSCA